MTITEIRGLRYPDEYVVKFFFKCGLDTTPGHVVEPGSGNGNNLALFSAYGWNVTGIDVLQSATDDAVANFADADGARFLTRDLNEGLPADYSGTIDCLSLANVINYLERSNLDRLLDEFAGWLAPDAWVFLRTRTPKDYRFARGREVGRHAFVLDTAETGEAGLLNVFYEQHELVDHLVGRLGVSPETLVCLQVDAQNPQGGRIVSNSDLVMWGRRSAS